MKYIKIFNQLSKSDIGIAGGKGASLGELIKIGVPVPAGFVILAPAFDRFLKETKLDVEIQAQLDKVNLDDINSVNNCSQTIRGLIDNFEMPADLQKETEKSYWLLVDRGGKKHKNQFVAVRSSATAEDSSTAAWAGQLDSYLYTSSNNLLSNVKKCWSSLFTERAIFYRFEKKLHQSPVSVAVVVQKMINSEISGVCFTVHPITKDRKQMVIETCYGLGEALVGGIITPDTYVVGKPEILNSKPEIIEKNISDQEKKIVYKSGGGTKEAKVPRQTRDKQKLSDEKILELARICQQIEKHYGLPQDIEFAIENSKIYIVQSRPITTL